MSPRLFDVPLIVVDEKKEFFGEQIRVAQLCAITDLTSLRATDGEKPLSKSQRAELLKASRSGEVVQLEIDIVATLEPDKPSPLPLSMRKLANANFSRFRLSEMPAFAKSFKGAPFLADHDRRSMSKIGGKIVNSFMDGDKMIQTVLLVKPWAVESALDGTMTTFSIGWDPKKSGHSGFLESAFCTVCNCSLFEYGACTHYPGDVVELDDGEKVIVELEWRKVRGAETSAVTFPAVKGTGVEEISQALSEARSSLTPTKQKEQTMDIRKLLGLASDATDADVAAKIEANATKLAAAEEVKAQKTVELEQLKVVAAARELNERNAKISSLSEKALDAGLWTPGSKRANLFAKLAKSSIEDASEFVDSLDAVVPVGLGAETKAIAKEETGEFATCLSDNYRGTYLNADAVRHAFKQLGLQERDLLEHGEHTRELNADRERVLGRVV